MAHFAELDQNNVVLRVVVIGDKDTSDANGVEKEHIGAAYCERLFGGRWVKTSYNHKIRRRYAGKGMTYNAELDAFIPPKPWQSWVLDEAAADWVAPVPRPEEGHWEWSEPAASWVPAPPPEDEAAAE